MSWTIVGTVPYDDFPMVEATCELADGKLCIGEHTVPVSRGTTALLAAACMTASVIGVQPPRAVLAGDIGLGYGSTRVYEHLVGTLKNRTDTKLIVFHYLLPDIDWHNRILIELDDLTDRPLLVADAGYMYVAKMSGFATSYDLFTPDTGEMAFLADEMAPHPFYTRGFLLQEEERIPELIERAYRHENAPTWLLVKGSCDLIASGAGIIQRICEPCVENMEPIGGTGDSLTGIVAALIASGMPIPAAATLAAKANRTMGFLTNPSPAFSIADLLSNLPEAVKLCASAGSLDARPSQAARAAVTKSF
ncbi:MAG TPA: sugar kinase [Desulfomonilaceae bacterium]|nr:sugar kinase [Desulfomonilaceae bacterium]